MTCKHLLNGSPDCVFCHRDQLKHELSLAEEGLANYAQEVERLKQLLNPRLWTREQNDAWHRAIPDLHKAFEALRTAPPSWGIPQNGGGSEPQTAEQPSQA